MRNSLSCTSGAPACMKCAEAALECCRAATALLGRGAPSNKTSCLRIFHPRLTLRFEPGLLRDSTPRLRSPASARFHATSFSRQPFMRPDRTRVHENQSCQEHRAPGRCCSWARCPCHVDSIFEAGRGGNSPVSCSLMKQEACQRPDVRPETAQSIISTCCVKMLSSFLNSLETHSETRLAYG